MKGIRCPWRSARNNAAASSGHMGTGKFRGVLVPFYQDGGSIVPTLLENPEELWTADPYVPVMTMQAAHTMAEISRQTPGVELAACVQCGLCEEACPRHRPLTSLIGRINRQLAHELAMR